MKSQQYVYFIKPVGLDGPIKIGCSDVPAERLKSLAAWSPLPLELIASIPGGHQLERNIHECFLDLLSHKEWFRADSRLVEAVAKIARGVPVEEAIDLNNRQGSMTSRWKRKTWAPETKARFGLQIRIGAAQRRARRLSGEDRWVKPELFDLANKWDGAGEMPAPLRALVDELVSDPVSATLNRKQRWPNWVSPASSDGRA